jgi:hypothetical protein
METKVLTTHGNLELVRLVPSGEVVVRSRGRGSIGLPRTEVEAIMADPSLMILVDLEQDSADESETQEIGAWTLTIEGEGEHPEELSGREDEPAAIAWAERLIRRGDYDLTEGETTTVRYSLRRGVVQVDRHVDVEG